MRTIVLFLLCASFLNCKENMPKSKGDDVLQKRHDMVEKQIVARGVSDARVLNAMRSIAREKFVPDEYVAQAYDDYPLPIGHDQTISQPFIVASMTEALHLDGSEKVLEIGTGSGYQAAVLGECAKEVFSIEIVEPLCLSSRELLESLNYQNVHIRCGNGYDGWPEEAPFDAIIVTAAPVEIPPKLLEQLAPNGRMVIPVGKYMQNLMLITKDEKGTVEKQTLYGVRFVPMTGGN
jgi:protein-L-isoaspartate(D-aspartate) O-methyltransferase